MKIFKFILGLSFLFTLFWNLSLSKVPDVCVKKDKCLGQSLYSGVNQYLKGELDNAQALNKRKIIQNFCKTMGKFKELPSKGKTSYKPGKSVFLRVLCSTVGSKGGDTELELKSDKERYYNKLMEEAEKGKTNIDKVGFHNPKSIFQYVYHFFVGTTYAMRTNGGGSLFKKCGYKKGIVTDKKSLNNVDFTCVAKDAFGKVASDMTTMSNFTAQGGFDGEEDRKKMEKDMFGLGDKSPCKDSFVESDDEDKQYCQHPEVLKEMKKNAKKLKKMLKKTKLIKIEPDEVRKKFTVNKGEKNPGANTLEIKDRAYNELYMYQTFLAYYSSVIKANNMAFALRKSSGEVRDLLTTDTNLENEVLNAKKYMKSAKRSLGKSFDTIKNTRSTYPVHLGLLSMQEDMKKNRKSLASLYTVLDMLRMKGEQAQDEGIDNGGTSGG